MYYVIMRGFIIVNIKLDLLKREISNLIANRLGELNIDADKIANTSAINALSEISCVIQNDKLSDFDAIEMIICILEKYNIQTGSRHDFG